MISFLNIYLKTDLVKFGEPPAEAALTGFVPLALVELAVAFFVVALSVLLGAVGAPYFDLESRVWLKLNKDKRIIKKDEK